MGADLAWPSERVLAFGLFLRESGFQIGPQEQRDFLRVLHAKPLATLGEVQLLWRPIACHSKRDHMAWQDLFLRFWEPHRTRGTTKVSGQTKPSRNLQQRVEQAKAHDSQTAQRAARISPCWRSQSLMSSLLKGLGQRNNIFSRTTNLLQPVHYRLPVA